MATVAHPSFWILRILLILAPWLCGTAAPGAPVPGKPFYHVYTDRDGLPQRTIYAMTRDTGGRIWAGTLAGIARFDGLRWETVATPPSNYITYVNANAMAALADGSVWIGTRFNGILEYRGGAFHRAHDAATGLPHDNVNAILESVEKDASGAPVIWAATYGKGLGRFADGRWTTVGKLAGLGDEKVFCLMEFTTPKGGPQLWAGTSQGIWIREQGQWRPFQANGQLPDPRVRALARTQDPDGGTSLWIGMEKEGLLRWRQGELTPLPLKAWTGVGSVRALVPDRDGNLWVGTSGGGVARVKGLEAEVLNLRTGLHSNFVHCLVAAPGGTLWFGSNGNGIARYKPGGWRRVHPPWPTEDNRIQSFWETRSPSGEPIFWAGSATQDLGCLARGQWSVLHAGPADSSETIRALYSFPGDGELYFGTAQGLGRLRGGKVQLFSAKEGYPGGQVRAITGSVDAAGRRTLWLGTSRGLLSWDGRAFQTLPAPPGDAEGSLRALAVDGSRLWVGTDRGLFCREGDRWLALPVLSRFQGIPVDAFIPVPSPVSPGHRGLWVGTLGSGVRLVEDVEDPESVRIFSTRTHPALPHDLVHDLILDGEGRVYVSTPRGVARLAPAGSGWTSEDFTQEDGLPSLEGLKGGLFQDSGGRIWVATQDDPAWLEPAQSTRDAKAKPLLWETATLQGRALHPGDALSHRDQGLHFQFRLLSYHREQDSRFRTQLVGLQTEPGPWVPEPAAQFPSLPAGDYTLLAWGRDYAGNVSGPISYPFRIKPAPWQTLWAYLAYAALLAAGVYGLLVLRTRFLAQRNAILEASIREATEEILRHQEEQKALNRELLRLNMEKNQLMGIAAHDLQNPLSSMLLVTDGLASGELGDCSEEALHWIHKASKAGHQMTALIHEFLDVNAIDSGSNQPRPRTVHAAEVVEPVLSLHRARAAAKGQTLLQEGLQAEMAVHADPNHLRQVLDNLVSNAIKFSPRDARLVVRVGADQDQVRFEVIDQGPGFTPADQERLFTRFAKLSARPTGGETSSGLGLSIVKHLVDANGGRIRVETQAGKGSTFIVELPRQATVPR